ncbi:hypothetical protein HGRIS_010035 [Hohenbuehelia grisea]|uniref:AAA+ ATPase domain-containing protein n=1 Tax=Hohenbuehelia grisea TaxID=104357 RepID=A0ABR3J3F6_9AGAR
MPPRRKPAKGKHAKPKAGDSSQRTLRDLLKPREQNLSQESVSSPGGSSQEVPPPSDLGSANDDLPQELDLNLESSKSEDLTSITYQPHLAIPSMDVEEDILPVSDGPSEASQLSNELPPSSPFSAPVLTISEPTSDFEVITVDDTSDGALPPSSPFSAPLESTSPRSVKQPENPPLPTLPAKPVHWFFTKRTTSPKAPEPIEILDEEELPPVQPQILTTPATPPPNFASKEATSAVPRLKTGLSFDNPIVLDSPTKTPHGDSRSASPPAFARQTNNCDTDTDAMRVDHSSPVRPIRVASHVPPSPGRPIHPMLAMASKSKAPSPSPSPRKKFRSNEGDDAPYPDAQSQHVNQSSKPFMTLTNPLGFRDPKGAGATHDAVESKSFSLSSLNTPDADAFLAPATHACVSACRTREEKQAYLESIPPGHERAHPVIGRIAGLLRADALPQPTAAAQRSWNDRWRPTGAAEVLGNEQSALYLRSWLRALALQSVPDTAPAAATTSQESNGRKGRKASNDKAKAASQAVKRPRVVRAVERPKRRKKRRVDSDDEDNWLADSESEDDVAQFDLLDDEPVLVDILSDEEMDNFAPRRLRRRGAPPQSLPPPPTEPPPSEFSEILKNTILLSGPPGSGKTAAVYACAEELGWEVFEVYPGIGKRSGTNLDNLVGEVGKNHLVRKTVHRVQEPGAEVKKGGLGNFFAKGRARKVILDDDDAQDSAPEPSSAAGPATRGDFGFIAAPGSQDSSTAAGVRQSIILLEEVDILFKEDANFWTAVTNLIKECKRPVICTCNGELFLIFIHTMNNLFDTPGFRSFFSAIE